MVEINWYCCPGRWRSLPEGYGLVPKAKIFCRDDFAPHIVFIHPFCISNCSYRGPVIDAPVRFLDGVGAVVKRVTDSRVATQVHSGQPVDPKIGKLNSIAAFIVSLPQRSVAFLEEGGMAVESEISRFNH